MRKMFVALGIIVALSLATPAAAGKASCSVTPNPDPIGQQFNISLTGGPASTALRVRVESQGHYLQFLGMTTDADGNGTSYGYPKTTGPTTVTIQELSNANVAKCGFDVV